MYIYIYIHTSLHSFLARLKYPLQLNIKKAPSYYMNFVCALCLMPNCLVSCEKEAYK